jgi:RNA polymerase sigma-70 factor (ECF subfamily)
MGPGTDDAELVAAAKADPRHFAILYERYFADVYRFLYRRAAHRELAADLTQQTFLKALAALSGYTSRGLPFRAWLYRIALNEMRMHWRKRREVVIDLSVEEVRGLCVEIDLDGDEEGLARLARALGELPEDAARLIGLRYFDGLSFVEVGQVLGIGEDAAKMRTHRVLGKLRRTITGTA